MKNQQITMQQMEDNSIRLINDIKSLKNELKEKDIVIETLQV